MLAKISLLSLLAFLVVLALADPRPAPTPPPIPKFELENRQSEFAHESATNTFIYLVVIVGSVLSHASSYGLLHP
jgi:hypothetical protein